MLIGFLGKKGSGKDTAADYLVKYYNFYKYAFALPVKQVCKVLFGFSDKQLYGDLKETIDSRWNITPRETFQKIGTEFGQIFIHQLFPNVNKKVQSREFWVHWFIMWYQDKIKENPNINVVISDVRFLHEIKAIKKLNGIIIKIERPCQTVVDTHISEIEIEQISDMWIDKHIINDTLLDDVYKKIKKIIDK